MPDEVAAEHETTFHLTREQIEEMVLSAASKSVAPAAYNIAAKILETYANAIEIAPVIGDSLQGRQGAESAIRKVATEARVMAEELRKMAND